MNESIDEMDVLDLIDEIRSCGGDVDENGYVTLYHNTSKESADSIRKSGKMMAKEDGIFFSTKPDGYASGYGTATLKFKIPANKLELDDVFDGEAHLRMPLKSRNQIVNVEKYLQTDIVTIFTGTDSSTGAKFLAKDFNDLTWWSDDYETLAHYYEGCAIEITVKLDSSKQEYVRDYDELNCDTANYTYGYAEMRCPKGAIWYSFSAFYLKKNVIEVKEIHPDLSKYEDDE